jgi:hypothetical protein
MMHDEADDGWSIHVPSNGFQTAEVESADEPAPLLPSARLLRLVIRDPDDPGVGESA